jgi:PPOX class probable F420-dependent enzyme
MGQASEPATTPFDSERFVSMETFKKDGRGVKTPVWVAPLDGRLVVVTDGTSFKVKRLRNNVKCRLAACTRRGHVTGPFHEATGKVIADARDSARADAALRKKYGWQITVLDVASTLTGRKKNRVYLELTVAAE